MRDVIEGPLPDIAVRMSKFLADIWPHTALVIFTRECTGRPRKVSGDPSIVERVTIAELDALRGRLAEGEPFDDSALIAGSKRKVWALLDGTGTLLLAVPKPRQHIRQVPLVAAAFGVVAVSIRHQVAQASPAYLAESRAASSERARTIAELTDVHTATLESLLATLRSKDLDDRRSRITASETASAALVTLRAAGESDRILTEEAVTTAFARLRGELRPLLQHRSVTVDYVDPPVDGRALPGEVAHAARAVVRGVVLAFAAQPALNRVRIAWDCDGTNLLVEVRDDGAGGLDTEALVRQLSGRIHTLNGRIDVESVAGWGSRVAVAIPLDLPAVRPDEHLLGDLNPRELEVLGNLATGRRNKAIADRLGISESTVKFHVAGVLRKLGVTSRGEAGAIALEAGVRSAT
ncbi:MAG: LuxR C-terminal-related transcriptional regulator [Rhodococcus sp. (in: high G+C Gram-positive bacteria)]|uniref:helix-turn-helix transcriptional regulator n=1 Tax=Rhodococcus sp. TaxID=1831 RepID=UPI003BAFB74A